MFLSSHYILYKKIEEKRIKRELLKPREHEINLEKEIGKRHCITNESSINEKGGYFCDICQCQLKDSHTYLDHINGKKHQKALGMSMKTPIASLNDVKERLKFHKRKYNEIETIDIKQRIKEKEEQEIRRKRLKKLKKKLKKNDNNNDNNNDNDNITQYEIEKIKNQNQNQNIKIDDSKKIDLIVEQNPLMEAMGFNFNFGGSKKNR